MEKAEIKSIIKETINELHKGNTDGYSAKVQEIGKDAKGSPRYMIYITKAANKLGIVKGDKIVFNINKIGHEKTGVNRNKDFANNLKQKNEAEKKEVKKEVEDPYEEDERDFMAKFKEANEFTKEKLVEKGVEQFGEKRVRELIDDLSPPEKVDEVTVKE